MPSESKLQIHPDFTGVFEAIGFKPATPFDNPNIKPWRTLSDRENCVWEFDQAGKHYRWHVKRFPTSRKNICAAAIEAEGFALLEKSAIPTARIIAWGQLDDGRSYIISEDLTGYQPADKLIASGVAFEKLLEPTADLAAKLHEANLHHRDLYLCHFMANVAAPEKDLRLIDAARVAELPGKLFRRRWIVKDLAQFWYSTYALKIGETERMKWLMRYCKQRKIDAIMPLQISIIKKCEQIARHDAKLNRKQPRRNISIPK